MKPKIKFCGFTRLEDASCAIELGVYALGFNFYKKSPRYVDPVNAKTIVRSLPPKAKMIGVFVNHTKDEVLEIARSVPLDGLQFHGDESPEFCAQFIDEWTVIKAIRLHEQIRQEEIEIYTAATDHLLFDHYDKFLYGGSGKEIDKSVLAKFNLKNLFKNAFLSGGLNPENVAEKISSLKPYGVDVASGIESSPGVKDRVKMIEFFKKSAKLLA